MLAYFCFLEQLLVDKMGSGAIAISLPFSCILGLLASMTSTTMVKRRYAWVYAGVQFALMVGFANIFYSLNVTGVLLVLLATFAGFSGAMCVTSIIYEFLKLRERWNNRPNQPHGTPKMESPQEQSEPAHAPQDDGQQLGGSIQAVRPHQPTDTSHRPQSESDMQGSQTQESGRQFMLIMKHIVEWTCVNCKQLILFIFRVFFFILLWQSSRPPDELVLCCL
ncbi:hypothetical protein Hdeb2414_s0028g00704851 [Helianthus debilis subsp. tardiflorus]